MAAGGKRLIVPLVVFIVLLAILVFAVDPLGWFKASEEELEAEDPTRFVLCDLSEDEISAVEIDSPEHGAFRLNREGEKWFAVKGENTYQANMDKVEPLLADLAGLKSEGLATDKADKHAEFEVDAAKGIMVKVFAGVEDPAVQLTVGKSAPGYKSSFVMQGEGPEVYRSSKNVKLNVGFSFNDYRTKKPFALHPMTAERITVRPPEDGAAQTFTKADGFWKTAEGTNGNQNLLNELIQKLSELTISNFVDDSEAESTGLEGVEPHLTVTTTEGDYILTLGSKEDSMYFLSDQDGWVYKASEYNLKFYLELAFAELSFDDTVSEEVEPDEGIVDELPSDTEEAEPDEAAAAEDETDAESADSEEPVAEVEDTEVEDADEADAEAGEGSETDTADGDEDDETSGDEDDEESDG